MIGATTVALAAGATGWLIAGGDLDRLPVLISFGVQPASTASPPDGVPVLIDSTPTGAEVRVDGTSGGVTPAQLSLSPGLHSLLVRQTSSMEVVQPLDIPSAGTSAYIQLWRRQPIVLPLRSMYPGAGLADARFLDEGELGLRVSSGAGPGLSQPNASDELWELARRRAAWSDTKWDQPPKHITDLVCTPNSRRLVVVTRTDSTPRPRPPRSG